jgi:uncharacterized protein (DUF924 family)
MTMSKPSDIIDFWFGSPGEDGDYPNRMSFWFGSSDADAEITERFADDVVAAARGDYNDWAATPTGRLALIILLDQFSRNLYRGTPVAFANDNKALELCLEGLEREDDIKLKTLQRTFFYLPMEHSEDLDIQNHCVATYECLAQDAPASLADAVAGNIDYAVQHRDVIARFGRFPHRNGILGRESTEEEIEFLKQPGSSF